MPVQLYSIFDSVLLKRLPLKQIVKCHIMFKGQYVFTQHVRKTELHPCTWFKGQYVFTQLCAILPKKNDWYVKKYVYIIIEKRTAYHHTDSPFRLFVEYKRSWKMDLSCQKHRMITWIELTNKQLSLQGDSRVEQQNERKTRE